MLKNKKTLNGGFSLYEILISLLILSILMSIAIPNLTKLISDSRKENTLDILNSAIYMAKNYAINNRKTVFLNFNTEGNTNSWQSIKVSTKDTTVFAYDNFSGYSIVTNDGMKFNMNGQVFSLDNQPITNKTFCVTNDVKGNTKYMLSVNYLGKTTFEEKDECTATTEKK